MGCSPWGRRGSDTTERLSSSSDKGASPRPGGSDVEKLSCHLTPTLPPKPPQTQPWAKRKITLKTQVV